MRSPPIDGLLEPFVAPLSHLVIRAAQVDQALVNPCAIVNTGVGDDVAEENKRRAAAGTLRSYGNDARGYLTGALAKLHGKLWRETAADAFAQFDEFRD